MLFAGSAEEVQDCVPKLCAFVSLICIEIMQAVSYNLVFRKEKVLSDIF